MTSAPARVEHEVEVDECGIDGSPAHDREDSTHLSTVVGLARVESPREAHCCILRQRECSDRRAWTATFDARKTPDPVDAHEGWRGVGGRNAASRSEKAGCN